MQKKTKYPKKRDLLIDIITNDKEIQVVMELPGVSEKEIKVNASQDNVTVATYDMKFNYYKRIQMPYLIDPKSLKTKYINGVLTSNLYKRC
ncbi:MAG: Hsp20 family protein [Candidatus Bathyarchaeota archaeon]